MDVEFFDVSSVGLIRDPKPHELAPEAFSTALNARFREGQIETVGAKQSILATVEIPPYFLALVRGIAEQIYIVYLGLTEARVFYAGTHYDISNVNPFNATGAKDWNNTFLGGVPIFNNGIDKIQYWDPAVPTTALQDLPVIGAAVRAKVVRAFGPYLVLYNVTQGATVFPHLVWWSTPADPGTVPSSWDYADPTTDAGRTDLPDTDSGVIVDARTLASGMYIYKEGSTWVQRFIGGRNIWSFDPFLVSSGILAPRCVQPTSDGKWHCVVTQDDMVLHNGSTVMPLLRGRMKETIFKAIDPTNYRNSFLFTKPDTSEMWFCFPENGQVQPSRALIWNYGMKAGDMGVITEAEVDFVAAATSDVEQTADPWNSDTDSWDTDQTTWDTSARRNVLVARPSDTTIHQLDLGSNNNGFPLRTFIEREGLAIIGRKRDGTPINDFAMIKMAKRIWIRATGGPFDVRVGMQTVVGGPITWTDIISFDPSTQKYIDPLISGCVLALQFSGTTPFSIEGWKLELMNRGRL